MYAVVMLSQIEFFLITLLILRYDESQGHDRRGDSAPGATGDPHRDHAAGRARQEADPQHQNRRWVYGLTSTHFLRISEKHNFLVLECLFTQQF